MTRTKALVFAIIGAVAATVFAVWLLKPHGDRLSVTLGVGFSEGAPTPETTRFAADMARRALGLARICKGDWRESCSSWLRKTELAPNEVGIS